MTSIKTDILVVGPENQKTGNIHFLWKTENKSETSESIWPLILTLKVISTAYVEQLYNNF